MTIKDACDLTLRDSRLKPETDGTTHCNQGVDEIFKALGFDVFENKEAHRIMLANEIIDWMDICPLFRKISMDEAIVAAASMNRLMVAGINEEPHGHVCVIYPGVDIILSGRLQRDVPYVLNIGKENKLMGLNFAFKELPRIWEFLGIT